MAVAFAVGIFLGMSPLLGLHTVLGLAAAWIFKLNRLITLVGVYVTNPWTIVPIYTFATFCGAKVLGMENIIPDIDWADISFFGLLSEFRSLLIPFIVGTTLLGLVSAAIGYLVIYRTAKSYHG
jgi:uncharacterized protein